MILLKILPWAPRMSPCIRRYDCRLGWPQPWLFFRQLLLVTVLKARWAGLQKTNPNTNPPSLGTSRCLWGSQCRFDFTTMRRETLLTTGYTTECHQFPGGHLSRSLQESTEEGVIQRWILPAQVSLPKLGRSMGHMDLCAIIPPVLQQALAKLPKIRWGSNSGLGLPGSLLPSRVKTRL